MDLKEHTVKSYDKDLKSIAETLETMLEMVMESIDMVAQMIKTRDATLIEKIKGRPDEHLLQTVLLRSMQQAVYSPDNIGHFGLAYEAYAHFTSPIRRYPDLLIHRAIKATLEKKKMPASNWHLLGQHCSMTERRADDATRDVSSWLKCYYMQDKIGIASCRERV